MADVSPHQPSRNRRDRGQLILVTGLLVAVTMVSLVLLLNTAIFTENLASRGADQSGREAVEYRGVLATEVAGLVEAENAREPGDWGTIHDTTETGVLRIDNYTARSYASRGTVVVLDRSSLALSEGQRIRQTDVARNFTNASGAATDWRLASGVDDTRAFSMTVDDTQLVDTTASDAETAGAFHVDVGSGGWEVFVYDEGGVSVAVSVGGSGPTPACSTTASSATLNLTAGTLDGSPCSGLSWADGVSTPYEVAFDNGENVTGTYSLTVNGTGADTANLNTDGTSPYATPVVYSASFDVYFESPTLTYRAPVRVAPGEPA